MTLKEFLDIWNSPEDTLLVHSSGSTGEPKPIWVEKRRMLNSARATCDFLGLRPGDTALLCLPLDYIAGKMMVIRSLERGLKLSVVDPSNHPLASMAFMSGTVPVDFIAMVPSQVYCSLQVPAEREVLRRVRHLIIGGGAISEELQESIDGLDWQGNVWSSYGMTETLSHIALRRLNGPGASGWYVPFDGVRVELNEDGCLLIDAPMVHDGVLETNDLAELRDGRFRILGRRDNVICSGGVKLQIEQIEAKLRPFIPVPFCITRRKDPKFGELVVMLLENGAGASSPVSDDQLRLAFSRLGRYEVPKSVLRVPEIPMTRTGKINRAEAEKMAR